jgi:K(+)-stimulated pyrophosphate-energized sodium pump
MIMYLILLVAVLSLGFAIYKAKKVSEKPIGNAKMAEISDMIHKGALTFLHKEYVILGIFLVAVAGLLFRFLSPELAVSFIIGGLFSAFAGNIGMRIATKANARAAEGVKKSVHEGLSIAFSSGSVMGFSVVGLGLLGVALLYIIFGDPNIIYGFGFGASSIALFARVGGGIYTKAADVGADLVGKVEKGIPEDDPRNPATIADNVGDNVTSIAL